MTTAIRVLSPEMEEKLDCDTKQRLGPYGWPTHQGNDYERHLFARRLRKLGKNREEVKQALLQVGLSDIQVTKREAYLDDILASVLVGFENTAPIYSEV